VWQWTRPPLGRVPAMPGVRVEQVRWWCAMIQRDAPAGDGQYTLVRVSAKLLENGDTDGCVRRARECDECGAVVVTVVRKCE